MAVHDGAAHIAATIASIVAQEAVAIELIVVDDASTDATPSILAGYAASDPRIRVLRNPVNEGLTRSLATACAVARAPFIARHDSGDLSLPSRLRKERAVLVESPGVALVSCWTEFVGPELERLYVVRGAQTAEREPVHIIDLTMPSGVKDGPTHHGSAMFRADVYAASGGYRPQFYYSQDWDLWFRIAERGKFHMLPEVLYRARVTPSSISTTARTRQEEYGQLARNALVARQTGVDEAPILAQAAALVPTHTQSKKQRALGSYFIGEALRRNGDVRARDYLRRAAFDRPTLLRAWTRWLQSLLTTRRV